MPDLSDDDQSQDGESQELTQEQKEAAFADLFPDLTPAQVKEAVDNSRKWERRAKENSAAAKRAQELEEQSKTEEQRTAERIAAAEKRAAELEAQVARAEIAEKTGVPVAVLAGPQSQDPEDLEAFARELKTWKGGDVRRPTADREGHRPDQETANKEAEARRVLGLDS